MKPLQEKASCTNAAPNEGGINNPHKAPRAGGGGTRYSSPLWFLTPVSPDQGCCDGAASQPGGCGSVAMPLAVSGCVGPDHTRMTTLENRSYLWLCFENCPVGPHGGPHIHTSGGQTLPAVVYTAFLHDQPGVNCFTLGSLGMCWLLFFSALFLAGGSEATVF